MNVDQICRLIMKMPLDMEVVTGDVRSTEFKSITGVHVVDGRLVIRTQATGEARRSKSADVPVTGADPYDTVKHGGSDPYDQVRRG